MFAGMRTLNGWSVVGVKYVHRGELNRLNSGKVREVEKPCEMAQMVLPKTTARLTSAMAANSASQPIRPRNHAQASRRPAPAIPMATYSVAGTAAKTT